MIKVPHIIEVDWDLEGIEIDDLDPRPLISTHRDPHRRRDSRRVGITSWRVELPSGLMEELVKTEIEGFEDKYEIISDYLSDTYTYGYTCMIGSL